VALVERHHEHAGGWLILVKDANPQDPASFEKVRVPLGDKLQRQPEEPVCLRLGDRTPEQE